MQHLISWIRHPRKEYTCKGCGQVIGGPDGHVLERLAHTYESGKRFATVHRFHAVCFFTTRLTTEHKKSKSWQSKKEDSKHVSARSRRNYVRRLMIAATTRESFLPLVEEYKALTEQYSLNDKYNRTHPDQKFKLDTLINDRLKPSYEWPE